MRLRRVGAFRTRPTSRMFRTFLAPFISLPLAVRASAAWPPARWGVAAGAAVLCALAVGLPTDVVPNPFFGRSVPVQWWNPPVLAGTALLGGMLLATYVRTASTGGVPDSGPARLGSLSGLLSFFAVGCPVCNKLVLLLLGTSGALNVWAPMQPLLAVAALVLLAVATVRRLAGELACPATARPGQPAHPA